MRCVLPLLTIMAFAGCSDPAPTTDSLNSQAPDGDGITTGVALVRDEAPPTVFNTQLRAENEPNGTSTSESKGHAQVKVLADGTIEFTLTLNNKGDETFTQAHIHKAPAGVNGPIHWDFFLLPDPDLTGPHPSLRGIASPRAAAVLEDLLANPEQYYVNVHSVAFPGGALRGQLP